MLGLIFGFKGRIDRGTWWMAYIGCIFLIIAGYSMARIGKDISHSAPMSALPLLFGALFCNLLGLIQRRDDDRSIRLSSSRSQRLSCGFG